MGMDMKRWILAAATGAEPSAYIIVGTRIRMNRMDWNEELRRHGPLDSWYKVELEDLTLSCAVIRFELTMTGWYDLDTGNIAMHLRHTCSGYLYMWSLVMIS